MKRKIDNILLEWKNISPRKVMLVRGARQVGKTYSIRQLGKTFKSGIRGKMQSIKIFFEEHKSPKGIRISLENFSHYNNIEVYPLYAIQKILR